MGSPKSDILLHPVRLRIVLATSGNRLTPAELSERLPDVPQASLYRHIARLAEAGVLDVVDERKIRGVTERTYAVNAEAMTIGAEDADAMTADEHHRSFAAFAGALIDAYGRYLSNPGARPSSDGVSYRQIPLNLSDEELERMAGELGAVLRRNLDLEPSPDRRRRLMSIVLMPDS
jgi:DNA-binding transcriptional ArsR family regulator